MPDAPEEAVEPELPKTWHVERSRLLADGIGGKVWEIRLAGGSRAIAKLPSALALKDGEPPRAAAFLRWRDGKGSIRLLDRAGDLLLLEHAGEQTLLDVFGTAGDTAATEIAAEIVERLHAPSATTPPASFQPLSEYFRSLFLKAEADRMARAESPFVPAAEVARRRLADQRDIRPLHGDIHHANILCGPRGWLAIDPKGLIGDPAFDIANLFYNPVASDLRENPERAATMAETLAKCLQSDAGRILDWAYAFAHLSASWHVEDGNFDEAERSLAVGRAVNAVRLRS